LYRDKYFFLDAFIQINPNVYRKGVTQGTCSQWLVVEIMPTRRKEHGLCEYNDMRILSMKANIYIYIYVLDMIEKS